MHFLTLKIQCLKSCENDVIKNIEAMNFWIKLNKPCRNWIYSMTEIE